MPDVRREISDGLMNEYGNLRKQLEKKFESYVKVKNSEKEFFSPTGLYKLNTAAYQSDGTVVGWNYSRGIVTRVRDGKVIADIKRNIGHFWHTWIEHPNGSEYLLCGEDYQGYSVLNLTQGLYHVLFPEEGHEGLGFCWAAVFPSPDKLVLAVDGCYWAHPYELVFYDFRTPDELPLKELDRTGDLLNSEGWLDNETFVMVKEVEIRKSDGALYDDLSEEEQQILDEKEDLMDYKNIKVEVKRPSFNI